MRKTSDPTTPKRFTESRPDHGPPFFSTIVSPGFDSIWWKLHCGAPKVMGQKICWQALNLAPIVTAARAGSSPAFDELVRRYKGATIGVAYSILGQPELSEDIAQESFLIAYRAMHQLKHPNRFPSWVCAIARNRAIRCLRDRKEDPMKVNVPSKTEISPSSDAFVVPSDLETCVEPSS